MVKCTSNVLLILFAGAFKMNEEGGGEAGTGGAPTGGETVTGGYDYRKLHNFPLIKVHNFIL